MESQEVAIKVDHISKIYRIGLKEEISDNLLKASLKFLKSPLSNYLKYRSLYKFKELDTENADNGNSAGLDVLWALKNITFDVKKGEVIGIIGANGAGKSTLLKILCKITHPTSGRAEIIGRVSSLLEVGTGFHPELTGRENIYLNGTILGMRKFEIDEKFEDIVSFSGVERFIDTPVKRYSSGMRVRLAFSVAAYLEPEILIVDEVLAVGDAEFQKKCLNKMSNISAEGRTVLFVSHNMGAISNLCSRGLLLQNGKMIYDGPPKDVIEQYHKVDKELSKTPIKDRKDRRGKGEVLIQDVEFFDKDYKPVIEPFTGESLIIRMHYETQDGKTLRNCRASIVVSRNDQIYFNLSTELRHSSPLILSHSGYLDFIIPRLPLSQSNYLLTVFIEADGIVQDWITAAANIRVFDGDFYGTNKNYPQGWQGKCVLIDFDWKKVDF
jgi:lipopolysaccharide transport system ATP-binding protein